MDRPLNLLVPLVLAVFSYYMFIFFCLCPIYVFFGTPNWAKDSFTPDGSEIFVQESGPGVELATLQYLLARVNELITTRPPSLDI